MDIPVPIAPFSTGRPKANEDVKALAKDDGIDRICFCLMGHFRLCGRSEQKTCGFDVSLSWRTVNAGRTLKNEGRF